MKIEILDEPELEFAAGARHIDIRFGLMHAGSLDVLNPAMRTISVGLVGTSETVEGFARWLDRCRGEIPAKESPYTNFFPRFPGFQPDTAFRSTLLLDSRTQHTIPVRDLAHLTKASRSNRAVEAAVEVFVDGMRYVAEKSRPDVIVCLPPSELWEAVKGDEDEASDGEHERPTGPSARSSGLMWNG